MKLGHTDLIVAPVGLGTVEIGLDYGLPDAASNGRPSENEAIRFLQQALDLGVNFLDTARVYGDSEPLIGRALKHRRSEYVLATKLVPISAADLSQPGLRAKVRASVEESLGNLQTDYVDLLMLHSAPLEVIRNGAELIGMLRDFQREGMARYIGASVYEQAGPEALRLGGFDCLQIAYNALDRSPESVTLPLAQEKGVGLVVRSVLLKGVLTDRYRDLPSELGSLQTAAAELDRIASDAGITLPELAYRYVLASDVVALCGTARVQELQAALEYARRGPLSAEVVSLVQAIKVTQPALLNPANWPQT